MTIEQLKLQIKEVIFPNGKNEIDGGKHQGVLLDLVDKFDVDIRDLDRALKDLNISGDASIKEVSDALSKFQSSQEAINTELHNKDVAQDKRMDELVKDISTNTANIEGTDSKVETNKVDIQYIKDNYLNKDNVNTLASKDDIAQLEYNINTANTELHNKDVAQDKRMDELVKDISTNTANIEGTDSKVETNKVDIQYIKDNYLNKDNVNTLASKDDIAQLEYNINTANTNLQKQSNKTKNWNSDVGLQYPDTRVYDGVLWRVKNGVTTLSTDIPNKTSDKWEMLGTKIELDTSGGALSFERWSDFKENFALREDIKLDIIGGYISNHGGFPTHSSYVRSDYKLLKKGSTVYAHVIGENIDNLAIAVYDLDKVFIPAKKQNYKDTTSYNDYSYTATEDCFVIVSSIGSLHSVFTSIEFLTGRNVDDEESVLGVVSYSRFNNLTENKTEKVYGYEKFTLQGYYGVTGLYMNEDSIERKTTPLIFLKKGHIITIKSLLVNCGVVFSESFEFVAAITATNDPGQAIFKTGQYTATEDCYVIAQTIDTTVDTVFYQYGEYYLSGERFLTPENIGTDSENGIVPMQEYLYFRQNGGLKKYDNGEFTGVGYNQGTSINKSVPKWRYTPKYLIRKGQVVTAYLAVEAAQTIPNQGANISIIIYGTDGVTVKERIRSVDLGWNMLSYIATEDCYIQLNHFHSEEYKLQQYFTITQPKIYATPEDISGGGSSGVGSGVAIPDVTRYNPKELITIHFETTDAIPTAKGSYMRGPGTIKIDGNILSKYLEFKVQGSSSVAFPQKNWTIALFDDELYTESYKMRLANFVKHNEFVLKANYIDQTHCRNIVANRVWEQIIQSRKGFPKRETDWAIYQKNGYAATETGALGHVDGFPAVLYINDEFYGIGTFNIGKKYYNYDLLKDDQSNIQIELENATNFSTMSGIEIRRPSTTNATTTANIQKFASIVNSSDFSSAARSGFWTTNIVDFYLFLEFFQLIDCVSRNSHIMSYDSGNRWFFTPYDLDTWAGGITGGAGGNPTVSLWSVALNVPAATLAFWRDSVQTEYNTEIKSRYKDLRNSGIFTADNIYNLCRDIQVKFGRDLFKTDLEKWTGKIVDYSNFQYLISFISSRIEWMDAVYG